MNQHQRQLASPLATSELVRPRRRGARSAFVAALLGLGLPALAAAAPPDPWATMARATAELRVGHPVEALELLGRLPDPGGARDRLLVEALLRSQALVLHGQPVEALAVLEPASRWVAEDVGLRRGLQLVALRAAHAAGELQTQRRAAEQLLASPAPPGWLVREARLRLAEALAGATAEGDRRRAVVELRALIDDRGATAALRATALAQWARLLPAGEQTPLLRQLVLEHGESDEGRWAATLVLPRSLPLDERMARVRRLLSARAYEQAEPELLQLLAEPAPRAELLLALGLVRLRLRAGYDRAVTYYEEVERLAPPALPAQLAEARFRKGIALGHLGRFREGAEAMRASLRAKPDSPWATEAGFQVGRLLHEGGGFADAVRELRDFLASPRRDPDMWRWFLAWSLLRGGQRGEARELLVRLASSRNLLVGPKALYWIARSLLVDGDRRGARAALTSLLARAPESYYGLLGAALLDREFPAVARRGSHPEARTLLPRRRGLPWPVEEWADLRPLERQKLPRELVAGIRRVRLLVAAGLLPLAQHEAERAQLEARLRTTLGRRAAEAEVDRLQRALEQYGQRWQEQARQRLPWDDRLPWERPEELRRAFPPAYLALARAAGREYDVSPWWLLAHMLQESRFAGRARSYVGALGPMQVMPATGRLIAAQIGFPPGDFSDEQLYDPGVALRQAAWYLAALRREFHGWLVPAMAAYNGGPLLIGQALAPRLALAGDELIEEIGAHESRNYARKVTDHLIRFATLYASDEERETLLRQLLPPSQLALPLGEVRF